MIDSKNNKNIILQRVIFPNNNNDLEKLGPLYFDWESILFTYVDNIKNLRSINDNYNESIFYLVNILKKDIISKFSLNIASNKYISLCSYFNSFPAGYWRRWCNLQEVLLIIRVVGKGAISIFRSDGSGNIYKIKQINFNDTKIINYKINLDSFLNGGWCWFDIASYRHSTVILQYAYWGKHVDVEFNSLSNRKKITIGITTFNEPKYCQNTVRNIFFDSYLSDITENITIVNQNPKKNIEHKEYFRNCYLSNKVDLINQKNLGGSGGFARCMHEFIKKNSSEYILLLDDDILIETESIIRLYLFSQFCQHPTIVGGQMFNMQNPCKLHAYGEAINMHQFIWHPIKGLDNHSFFLKSLRNSPSLHQNYEVDYNGWWMCLIPKVIINKVGLPLPFFIKWDDAEYSLRAKIKHYNTVTLPGAAVWHISWDNKDDSLNWQAYFHVRNRIITALIHSPYKKGGNIIWDNFKHNLKHLISMQYYTVTLRNKAIKDLMKGPVYLYKYMKTIKNVLHEKEAYFSDSFAKKNYSDFPYIHKPNNYNSNLENHISGKLFFKILFLLKIIFKNIMIKSTKQSKLYPSLIIANKYKKWWNIAKYDSIIVSNSNGNAIFWYKRKVIIFNKLLYKSCILHLFLFLRWKKLKLKYKILFLKKSFLKTKWNEYFNKTIN